MCGKTVRGIIRGRKGSSTVYELLICLLLLTFVSMFPVGLFAYLHKINSLNNAETVAVQALSSDGRFDVSLYDALNRNLQREGFPALGQRSTNTSDTSPHSYIVSSVAVTKSTGSGYTAVNEPGIYTVPVSSSDGRSYAVKYRNGYSYTDAPDTVYFSMRCSNRECPMCGKTYYVRMNDAGTGLVTEDGSKSGDSFACPYCGKASYTETCVNAEQITFTVFVPVTDQVKFLAKAMNLVVFGAVKDADIAGTMQNIQETDAGQYYFTKTYTVAAEPYYFTGSVRNGGNK